jgi:hypothetical protein
MIQIAANPGTSADQQYKNATSKLPVRVSLLSWNCDRKAAKRKILGFPNQRGLDNIVPISSGEKSNKKIKSL